LGSALAMDKDKFKAVMRDSQIPVTGNIVLREGDELRNPFGYPVFVKPARLGSSVGISKVRSEEELGAAVELAFRHDEKVLVEELNTIPGFTATSVYAKLFEASGIPYPELLDRLVELALERHERRSRLEF